MSELNETPRGSRIHIAFFGLRNAGKSTLVNAFTGQQVAIVSDVAGTTTDPVSKAMEILPLGPCLITDTAGLDDTGALGLQRVEKSLAVLATTDIAVWVAAEADEASSSERRLFDETCRRRGVTVIDFRRGDSVDALKRRIADVKLVDRQSGLLEGLVKRNDRILCIVPIDESAPKGRLILPQQQVIRECLDIGAICTVCQPSELLAADRSQSTAVDGRRLKPTDFDLAITDSQAFHQIAPLFERGPRLTSFSILFARQKGDLAECVKGLEALRELKDGDMVLIAEGCTHHRQCNDIGTVKIPKALGKLTGRELRFVFSSGNTFEIPANSRVSLVVHCGGCMLTRREVLRRIALARSAGVPIVNYGLLLAAASGLHMSISSPEVTAQSGS